MRKAVLSILLTFGALTTLWAQSAEQGIKQFNNQNYRSTVRIFSPLVKQESGSGENYYYLGNAYAFLGKWDSARAVFSAGIAAAPKYPQNYAGLAKTYLNENNSARAMELFSQAKDLVSKKDVSYYVWVADAYMHNSKPNTTEAINQLKSAIAINYKVASVYMALGDAYYLANDGGNAVNNYDLALQYDPSLFNANSRIGYVWISAKKYAEAAAAFQKALAVDPNYAPALKGLSQVYFWTGQYDKAKTTYEQYMKVGDVNDDDRYFYGTILFLGKDYQGTQNLLHDLMKRDSSNAIMYRLGAYSDYEQGNIDNAAREIKKFFSLAEPGKILGSDYEYQGKILQKQGQDSLAIISYRKAVETDTTKKALYGDIAQMYYAKKKYKDAAAFYGLAGKTSKDPTVQLQNYYKMGIAYYLDSSYKRADTAFTKLTEISPKWVVGYLWRAHANLYNDSMKMGPALPYYQKMLEIAIPDTNKYNAFITGNQLDSIKNKKEIIEAYSYIGNYYTLNGRYEEAKAMYRKVLALDPNNADIKKTYDAILESEKKPKKGK